MDQSIDLLPNPFMITVAVAVVGGDFLVKMLITECGVRYLMAGRGGVDNLDFGRIELWERRLA